MEKEREIKNFKPEEYWAIGVRLKKKDEEFDARLSKINDKTVGKMGVKTQKEAEKIAKDLEKSDYLINNITKKEVSRSPLPPYTTSTLQQDANIKLGYSAKQTMMLAQGLYEGVSLGKKEAVGLITYMRTDSVNLSLESLVSAKKIIETKFGKDYPLESPRYFKSKSKNAQEAHEAIRPTDPMRDPESIEEYLDSKSFRLYRLIWQRMVASQMTEAIMDSVSADIEAKAEKTEYVLRASGSKIKFAGYLKAYEDTVSAKDNYLPELKKSDRLDLVKLLKEQKFTQPPARYSEAALIKVMEENGIGRPSTYAPTISTLIERKYIERDDQKKFFPEEIGFLVSDLLVEHFSEIVDYQFTAQMEEDLDEIAEGKKQWVPVISAFYKPFHKNLKEKTGSVKKEDFQEKLDKKCPDCGGDLIVKFGRFGKFIACSNYPECRYTEKTAEEKKIDEAHQGEKCEKCGAPMVVKRGRFGAFLGCSNYPTCKNIKKIENKTGVKCPKCGQGEIVERKSKRGRNFYGCNTYPKCDFALWQKPTGETCPKCNSLITFAAKGKVKCSNKECGFEK